MEVTEERSAAITQSSASVGEVLTAENVRDLPRVSNSVVDLMKTMAGIRGDGLGTDTTFAGISTAFVNTTRDGISVQENRYNLGVTSTTVINPDLVGEMRVILAPVDAETGRGNGQVQLLTRSGTRDLTQKLNLDVRYIDTRVLYGNGVADVVGLFSLRKGSVHWGDPGPSGTLVGGYFESGALGKVKDPQCSLVAASLARGDHRTLLDRARVPDTRRTSPVAVCVSPRRHARRGDCE